MRDYGQFPESSPEEDEVSAAAGAGGAHASKKSRRSAAAEQKRKPARGGSGGAKAAARAAVRRAREAKARFERAQADTQAKFRASREARFRLNSTALDRLRAAEEAVPANTNGGAAEGGAAHARAALLPRQMRCPRADCQGAFLMPARGAAAAAGEELAAAEEHLQRRSACSMCEAAVCLICHEEMEARARARALVLPTCFSTSIVPSTRPDLRAAHDSRGAALIAPTPPGSRERRHYLASAVTAPQP